MSQAYEGRLKEMKVSLKQSQTEREKINSDLAAIIKSKSADQDNKVFFSLLNEQYRLNLKEN